MSLSAEIRYLVRFPAPQAHYAEVEVDAPAGGRSAIEMMMAVWTPGSYLVREYSGQVEAVSAAAAGRDLAVTKTAKNRWRVETGGAERIRFSYKIYCRQMTVRTNWVERDFAILNGAPTFMTVLDAAGQPAPGPYRIALEPPSNWPLSRSGMEPTGQHAWVAADFDEVIDSPILAGDLAVYDFEVQGAPHALVNLGEGGVWDGDRSAKDVETIARAEIDFWGVIPYERYAFLNAITESGGGLEHKSSTLMMARRYATETRKTYIRWLMLVAHEYFHTWNVKRLRPIELGPFDYEAENYTTGLWVAEGITSYYDPLFVRRTGLMTREEYLEELSSGIDALRNQPGRLVQSASEASRDAWVKAYRRNENSPNTTISYYTKGSLVAFLLDARIRKNSDGKRSLDDAMRLAYERFSGEKGFTQEQFRAAVSEVAGEDLTVWFRRNVDEPGELDYTPAFEYFGLRFKEDSNGEDDDDPKPYLGASVENRDGRLIVTRVLRETPAFEAGVNVDDELIAIDGYRLPASGLDDRLEAFAPGDTIQLLVSRREKLLTLDAKLAEKPREWKLEIHPEATDDQKTRLTAWLGE